MRARVLTRSHPTSSGSSNVAGPCAHLAKRRRLDKSSAQTVEPKSQDTLDLDINIEFELPQLDALVQGIDPDQHFDWRDIADTTPGMQASDIQRVMMPQAIPDYPV